MTSAADSPENSLDPVSENSSKTKRRGGRPRKYTFEEYDWLPKMLGSQKRCARSKQNYINARRTFDLITSESNLPEEVKVFMLSCLNSRRTVAAELGRFSDTRVVISVAKQICFNRMSTEKAVGLCRRMRGIGSPDVLHLSEAIERTIRKYRERYQTLSPADVAVALRMVSCE